MKTEDSKKKVYVIDLLPEQVPADCGGQFFAIERFWLESGVNETLAQKFFNILLKLNCYFAFQLTVDEFSVLNPDPKTLKDWIQKTMQGENQEGLSILCDQSLIRLNDGELCLVFEDPTPEMQRILTALAQSEGLFFWRVPEPQQIFEDSPL